MTHAVGIRTYQVFASKKGSSEISDPNDSEMKKSVSAFLKDFVSSKSENVKKPELEKTWKIIEKENGNAGNSRGQIKYGRYGYGADLEDIETGQSSYKRKRTDSEIIYLYYRFWTPDKEKFSLFAFSSFSGKSCINIIFDDMRKEFEEINQNHSLKINRLIPANSVTDLYGSYPVKSIRFASRKSFKDDSDKLLRDLFPEISKLSLSLHAKRNQSFGKLQDIIDRFSGSGGSGTFIYNGESFDEAVATVKIGNDLRSVGVFGVNNDVGLIDITDHIVKDDEGLPTYESLNLESGKILEEMYKMIRGMGKEK